MSEKMLVAGNSKDSKTSRFAEGRLKLSTSCTECHRRKQKCDQKQPCKHCSRRFPTPQCIYRSIDGLVPSRESSNTPPQSDKGQGVSPSRIPLSKAKSNPQRPSSKPPTVPCDFSSENIAQEDAQDVKLIVGSGISTSLLDSWGSSEYQALVGTMMSNLRDALDPEDEESNSIFHRSSTATGYSPGSKDLTSRKRLGRESQGLLAVGRPSSFSISSVDPLHFLGITPTYQSGELLQAFLKIITKFVVSIDGRPRANYYNDTWIPWSMKSPLLVYMGIFTASCYQSEAQKIPPPQSPIVIGYKLRSIRLLNEMLRNKETATCTEAIAAVSYLCTHEWYWSDYENVKAHLRGLKEMVRLRGGLGELGSEDFVRRMVILNDYSISCSYDLDLSFPHNTATHVRYPVQLSCPLLYSLVTFSSIKDQLGISMETSAILDDMRFVTMAVMKLLDFSQSAEEVAKLCATTRWIQDRISSLSDGSDPTSPLAHDFIYRSCRIAALIYCRAVTQQIPLSKACTLQDLNQLWACMWRVTLTRWKEVPGIFVWIILAGNQAAQTTPHGRFLKSTLKAAMAFIGLDHFDVIDSSLMNFSKLQQWLRIEREEWVKEVISSETPEHLPFLHNYKSGK